MAILRFKKILIVSMFLFISILAILYYHSVDKSLTKDDKEYIPKFLKNITLISKESSYMEELEFISSIQKSVLKVAPNSGSIPKNKPREPKDVYIAGMAGCSERSRVLSKIFKYYGFKTRQFSMYSKKISSSSIVVLLSSSSLNDIIFRKLKLKWPDVPGVRSHSSVEVLTKKGWLVVDPNKPWLSIDALNNPLSINKIQYDVDNSIYIDWKQPPDDEIYLDSFVYVHGLYSRHGRFYPPFNFIPDINYRELIQNVL